MKSKRNLKLTIVSIANGFLFLVIPDYFFWFLIILGIGLIICIAALIADFNDKTSNSKEAFRIFVFGLFSYIFGIGLIILYNRLT